MAELTVTLRDTRNRELELTDPYIVKELEGLGPPEVDQLTRQGPYQRGETWEDSLMQARIIAIALDIVPDASTDGLWTLRQALVNKLAAYKQGVYLCLHMEDDDGFDLDVETFGRYERSVEVKRDDRDGPGAQRVAFAIRCHDSVLYDPTPIIWVVVLAVGEGVWSFDLGFPEGFGSGALADEETFEYEGTASSYPVITIDGPATDLVITNESTDEKLDFTGYTIAAGEEVEIDTRYGQKSVTSDVDGNIQDELTDDSDLATFHIAPDPELLNGENTISVAATGTTSETRVEIQFYVNYGGI